MLEEGFIYYSDLFHTIQIYQINTVKQRGTQPQRAYKSLSYNKYTPTHTVHFAGQIEKNKTHVTC